MTTPREQKAQALLDTFASATGLRGGAEQRRYLWTDAFAVCTWLGVGEPERALQLVDRVHHALGRHRPDDERDGWISGLPEADGEEHPTAGGLRIGKPLPERGADEPFDRRLEWERDGQYFHYLTKWARALDRTAVFTDRSRYRAWAVELGTTAFDAFGHGRGRVTTGLYWKMSIDLSRPLVPSQGQHDPLDGYVTLSALRAGGGERDGGVERSGVESTPDSHAANLDGAIDALADMVGNTELATDDPLGLGSLLADAWFLARITGPEEPQRRRILERTLDAVTASLPRVRRSRLLELPATQRLAFRELGLALGLEAIDRLGRSDPGNAPQRWARDRARSIDDAGELAAAIRRFWLDPENQASPTWADHQDINAVMLAASLAPVGYLGT